MTEKIGIHWFRQDLRLGDNPALINATQHQQVLPIYILDDINAGDNAMGGASRWWLHYSLTFACTIPGWSAISLSGQSNRNLQGYHRAF